MQLSTAMFDKWQSAPIASLLAFILVLPSFEMPKMVFLWLFIVLAGATFWNNRSQVCWRADDSLLVIWMLSGVVVALFSGIHGNEWVGAKGNAILILFFLVLKHVTLSENLAKIVRLTILWSTLFAACEGLWQLFGSKQRELLELNSVGHVNHSAIYLGVNFALVLAMVLVLSKSESFKLRFFVVFSLLFTVACIILSNSRATIMTMAVIAVSYGLIWLKRSKWPLLVLVSSILAASAALYFENAQVVQKHVQQTSQGPFLGERQAIWNSGLLAWRQFPVFGIGTRNFGRLSKELQSDWLVKEGKNYAEGQYMTASHPHNFYLSLLVEQGIFGLTITLSVMGRVGYLLFKSRPEASDSNSYWCGWLAAFGAVQVVLVNGLLNTTLHHEHGLLTLLLIGMWWANLGQRARG
ncbi:O-antigen ligase family protein [Methylomonas sp. MgM2]